MRILTAKQMLLAEQSAAENGIGFGRLMENAGSACAKWTLQAYDLAASPGTRVGIVCGKGNNGGDGLVIARRLYEAGCAVTVILLAPIAENSLAGEMLARLEPLQIRYIAAYTDLPAALEAVGRQALLVDAIFGTGFHGQPDMLHTQILQAMNAATAPTVCVDLPSGLVCDSAERPQTCIQADATIAIAAYKPVHVFEPARSACGRVHLVHIGLQAEDFAAVDAAALYTYTPQEVRGLLPKRSAVSHKGNFGHVLQICGSRNMQGAAVLAALGAVTCGAGLVTAAFPESAYNAIAPKLTEPLLLPLPANAQGTLRVAALPGLLEAAQKADAVVLGCGLGQNADTIEIVQTLLRELTIPIVLDADGINALRGNIDILKASRAPLLLTPHPGEFSRLSGLPVAQSYQARVESAREFAQQVGCTLVLKGANTVVATGGDARVFVNNTGNAGMATGGSGDLLAGMLGSLLAQGMAPLRAACCGVHLHGAAGDSCTVRLSQRGMTPSASVADLARLLSRYE